MPKTTKISVASQIKRAVTVLSDKTIQSKQPLEVVHFGRSDRNLRVTFYQTSPSLVENGKASPPGWRRLNRNCRPIGL